MITVSLCMIVKDEEEVLARCLDSIQDLADEIIIVDTGSKDKTKEIAAKYTSKIYDFKWVDDFSAARNYSFSKAAEEYIFWLDADDVLLEEDRIKFKLLKGKMKKDIDVVMMKYSLGTDEKGNAALSFYRERLLKRSRNFKWYDPVHEYIAFEGNIVNSDVSVTHKKLRSSGKRNLDIFEKFISQGKELSNRNLFYYARELFLNGRYDEAIICYSKFLDTDDGFISNYLDSCIDLSKCYKLKGDTENALKSLYKSFDYDPPHAEICCMLGYHYKSIRDYEKAIFWFDMALKFKKPESSWGFIIPDCWGFIPYMELSICYYKTGNLKEAVKYNELAACIKPGHPVVLQNRKYFMDILDKYKSD